MIFKCTQRDIAAVGRFYDQTVLYLTQHENFPLWEYKNYPSERSVAAAVAEGSQFAYVENGEILGAFVLNCDPQGNYAKVKWSKFIPDGEYVVIHSFATRQDCLRRGIATKMLNFCLDYAKKCNMKAIRLDVVPKNLPARIFYEKNGFRFVEETGLDRVFDIPTFCFYELNF